MFSSRYNITRREEIKNIPKYKLKNIIIFETRARPLFINVCVCVSNNEYVRTSYYACIILLCYIRIILFCTTTTFSPAATLVSACYYNIFMSCIIIITATSLYYYYIISVAAACCYCDVNDQRQCEPTTGKRNRRTAASISAQPCRENIWPYI